VASANDGLSSDEKKANQLQVDSILQTIDRISAATNFQGIKLLNGNLDYTTSGLAATNITDFRVNSAKYTGSSQNVTVNVTGSAQQAGLFLLTNADAAAGGAINLNAGSSFVIEISGSKGSREFTFAEGTTVAQIKDAIDALKSVTGVETSSTTASGLKLISTDFGSNEFVSVKTLKDGGLNSTTSGSTNVTAVGVYGYTGTGFFTRATSISTYTAITNGTRDKGQDVTGTINGLAATGKGKALRVATDYLDVEVTLANSVVRTVGNVAGGASSTVSFSITGGGADFNLASKVDLTGKVSLGIQNIATRSLGTSALGYLNSLGTGKTNNIENTQDLGDAQKIVAEAINQVSSLRGRLGAFQKNVVGATIRSLNISVENTAAAQSAIRDADFAAETANLTRAQILVSAATNVLSLANSAPQSALQLLG
jgi:flagellin